MDNERQIKNKIIIDKTKEYFFEGLSIIENKILHSSIENEYKKAVSKRNKGLVVVLILFVVTALTITWFVSETLSGKSIDTSVNIDNFRELNLAEIVQNIKTSKSKIKGLQTSLQEKQFLLENEIEKIRNKAKREIGALNRQKLGEDMYQQAVQEILAKRDTDIQKLVDIYSQEEVTISREINALNTQVKTQEEAYTKINYEAITTQNNNQNSVTPTNSILYYNETLEQDYYTLIRQNEEYKRDVITLQNMLKGERERVSNAQILTTNMNEYALLINKLEEEKKTQTQENTQLKNQLEEERNQFLQLNSAGTNAAALSYNKLIDDMKKEKLLYYNSLETLLLKDKNGAGYVLDYIGGDLNLFISKVYNIEKGQRVFIYRGNTFIAELEITSIADDRLSIVAKVIRIAQREKITAFDSVILGGITN